MNDDYWQGIGTFCLRNNATLPAYARIHPQYQQELNNQISLGKVFDNSIGFHACYIWNSLHPTQENGVPVLRITVHNKTYP